MRIFRRRGLIAGIAIGVVLGGSVAFAGIRILVVPAGSKVIVRAGRGSNSTGLTFSALDLGCVYTRVAATGTSRYDLPAGPVLLCNRASVRNGTARVVAVTPYSYMVSSEQGQFTYRADRVP